MFHRISMQRYERCSWHRIEQQCSITLTDLIHCAAKGRSADSGTDGKHHQLKDRRRWLQVVSEGILKFSCFTCTFTYRITDDNDGDMGVGEWWGWQLYYPGMLLESALIISMPCSLQHINLSIYQEATSHVDCIIGMPLLTECTVSYISLYCLSWLFMSKYYYGVINYIRIIAGKLFQCLEFKALTCTH